MGWISLHRSIFEDEHYFGGKFDYTRCWIDLLLLAETTKRVITVRGQEITLERGQVALSNKQLCERWGYGSHNTVSRILNEMERNGKVTIKRSKLINILTIKKYNDYQQNTAITPAKVTIKSDHQSDHQSDHHSNKLNNKETPPTEGQRKKTEPDLSFVDAAFRDTFALWLQYKKERRESYKSPTSTKTCYNKLLKLAGNDPVTAGLIVEQSIANNWQGLFALKPSTYGTANNQHAGRSREEKLAVLQAAMRQVADEEQDARPLPF